LQYLLGEWEFYGCPFKVGKGVLIPRPETELLVDLALEYKVEVFDLCAGSGCVGIAYAGQSDCTVMAIEKSPEAFRYLQANIALNKVEKQVNAFCKDILDPEVIELVNNVLTIINQNAAILINPPYLSRNDIRELQKEVRKEPMMALFGGGEDGLDFFREFFAVWGDTLSRVRLVACEVGDGQAEAVCELMREVGLSPQVKRDYNGTDRVVYSVVS
jgi:release factor glutamine methyltransferase